MNSIGYNILTNIILINLGYHLDWAFSSKIAIWLMLGTNYFVKMKPMPNRVEFHQAPLKRKEIYAV
jgi:hypothetical protein